MSRSGSKYGNIRNENQLVLTHVIVHSWPCLPVLVQIFSVEVWTAGSPDNMMCRSAHHCLERTVDPLRRGERCSVNVKSHTNTEIDCLEQHTPQSIYISGPVS